VKVTLVEVPYDSGHYARRLGRGPARLVEGGLPGRLERAGHDVRRLEVRVDEPFPTEVGTALATQRLVAEGVASELGAGRFPLVLAGNCATAVGSVAGAGAGRTGVVWLDSHGDYNTPETSRSGFFDGMALAMLTGECWTTAAGGVSGFAPVPAANVVLVGGRDFDPGEDERMDRAGVRRVGVGEIRHRGAAAALRSALDDLAARVERIYLHLDLDVLDPGEARINPFQAPSGLTIDEVEATIRAAAECRPIRVAALTAFDPDADPDGAGVEAAMRLAAALADAVG
jgi:arginase